MSPNKYMILTSRHPDGLARAVNQALRQGWQLHGRPFSHDGLLVQAVIRRTVPAPYREPVVVKEAQ